MVCVRSLSSQLWAANSSGASLAFEVLKRIEFLISSLNISFYVLAHDVLGDDFGYSLLAKRTGVFDFIDPFIYARLAEDVLTSIELGFNFYCNFFEANCVCRKLLFWTENFLTHLAVFLNSTSEGV